MIDLKHKLNSFYEKVKIFTIEANKNLPKDNQLYFSGEICSGNLKNPELLFLSINPGYSASDWVKFQNNPKKITSSGFNLPPCKYIAETEEGLSLASKITDVFFNGDKSKYNICAETFFKSFFATPKEYILKQQLLILPSEIRQKHTDIMKEYRNFIFELFTPKHVVCIGLTVFNEVTNFLQINNKDIFMRSYKTVSGKTERVYYKEVKYGNTTIHGILHLSGARIALVAINEMKNIFSQII